MNLIYVWIIIVLVQLALRGLSTHFTVLIYEFSGGDGDGDELVNYYVLCEVLYNLFDLFICPFLVIRLAYDAQRKYEYNEFVRYDHLSFEAKKVINSHMFWNVMSKAGVAIYDIRAWGMGAFVDISSALVVLVYTFIASSLYVEIAIMVAVYLLVWLLVIRPWQARFTVVESKYKNIMNESSVKIILNLYPFQYHEREAGYMASVRRRESDSSEQIDLGWQRIISASGFVTKIITFSLLLHSPNKFMLLVLVLVQLDYVVRYCMIVVMRYMKMSLDIQKYDETMKGAEVRRLNVEKLPLPNNLMVTGCSIVKEGFSVTFADCDCGSDFAQLPFYPGIRILIQGASGHGKTTFVDGLCGKIDGITLNHGMPENYYHLVADMFQNIREKMPSSTTTIRDYFKDEENDELIERCLQTVFMNDEICFIRSMLETTDLGYLDTEINERFSGGMKSRLCAATRVYEIEKYGKRIFIMDEIEQGSDYESTAYMLRNIFNGYPKISIIMITHMYPTQLIDLGLSFDVKLLVKHGKVYILENPIAKREIEITKSDLYEIELS
jgi:ABC-type transport system involved in cytochrome bd biosynthesis fused ATPase/permease subunit